MGATQSSDFVFEPKVWQDHIRAYFDKKLVFGRFASRDTSLTEDAGKGMTVNFPYFKAIGAAEEPAETSGLVVDNLEDDSFSCTVKEVGKAVGVKKKAFKKSAAKTSAIVDEVQRQIARVMAEKVDSDLLDEFSDSGNFTVGYLATDNLHVMNVRTLVEGKIKAFGDKSDEAIVCFMHSLQFLDLLKDSTAGFLSANTNDPMFGLEGFKGRLAGMAIVTSDQMPKENDIDSVDAYSAYIHKLNPYGIIQKQDMEIESDYDILQREWVFTGNEWYGVKSFHGKINSLDRKTAKVTTTLSVADGL
jgi:hypothetical protein